MTTATSGELGENLHDILSRALFGRERALLTQHGTPVAAIISLEDLELLQELEDRFDMGEAVEALREVETAGLIPWRHVKSEASR